VIASDDPPVAYAGCLHNNPAERALRPIGIGRKNWLFAGADTGLDPLAYLADILDRIHDHKINRLNELLPWNWVPLASVTRSQAA